MELKKIEETFNLD